MAETPTPIIIVDDPEEGPTTVGLTDRPGGDEGRMWDITVKWRTGATNPALRWWGHRDIVDRVARNKGIDPALLMAVVIARFGFVPPERDLQKQVALVGNALRRKPRTVGLNKWFNRTFTNAVKPGGVLPGSYVKRVRGGVTLPTPTSDGVPDSVQDVFDSLPNGKAWAAVWGQIQNAAGETRAANGNTFTIDATELLGALVARGFDPKSLTKKNISAIASSFATRDAYVTLDDWYANTWGEPRGPGTPDSILAQAERDVPQTGKQKARSKKAQQDFLDPVVLTTKTGVDVRQSDLDRFYTQYQPMFQFYIGRDPSADELKDIIRRGVSNYQLAIDLTKDPRFFRSQAWKSQRLTYIGVWNDMHGATRQKAPRQLIRKAIVNNWSAGEFAEALRGREDYFESNEFNSSLASLQNVYAKVFGGPITDGVKTTLREAALARWSPDQFATWLRSRPEYGTSTEFKTKMNTFATEMGRAFGRHVQLPSNLAPPVTAPSFDLPDSERVEGAPGAIAPPVSQNV